MNLIFCENRLFALNLIQNLEVNRQADAIRGQADLENANAVNTSRMMNLENIMKNNGIRNEVANRNISTLAGARQAKRQAEKQGREAHGCATKEE